MNSSTTSLATPHVPVMLEEVIKICSPSKGGIFLDCTFGGGGYSKELLKFSNTKVVALDRDSSVYKNAEKFKKIYPSQFSFFNEKFSNIDKIVGKDLRPDVIIFDLGLSMIQLMDYSRGFSFKSKKKIDMQMGLSSISAEDVVNKFDEKSLKLIIRIFGDEQEASKIAKNIILARKIKAITAVDELVQIIEKSKKKDFRKKINVSTKTFQALRIFVNKEVTELITGLIKSAKVIRLGGKIIVVSFHSIEDRIVKYFFNNYSSNKSNPSRYLPPDNNQSLLLFDKHKNKPQYPCKEEIKNNPASRSAKLRFAVRCEQDFIYPEEFKTKFKKYLDLEAINE